MTNDLLYNQENITPLSEETQTALFYQLKQGNKEARNQLIIHNLLLVKSIVNKIWNINYDKEELISIGILGLIKSIDTFNPRKNLKFSTYSTVCIRNEIFLFYRFEKKYQTVASLNEEIKTFYDEPPSKFQGEKIERLITEEGNPLSQIEKQASNQEIHELLNQIPSRDREILKLHYGFYNDKVYTQTEIAQIQNISQSLVSRIIKKYLKILKQQLETPQIPNKKVKRKK